MKMKRFNIIGMLTSDDIQLLVIFMRSCDISNNLESSSLDFGGW